MTPHFKRKAIHYWYRQIRPILVIILVFTSFRSTVADWNDVPSGSMEPTIFVGDRVFVNKLAYGLKIPFTTIHLAKWSAPQRGEIAVFYSPEDGVRLIKRVVGVPGDQIAYKDGMLTINGNPVPYTPYSPPDFSEIPTEQQRDFQFFLEQLGDHQHVTALLNRAGLQNRMMRNQLPLRDGTYTVPPDQYFMMGDNRDNSKDSRFIGCVRRDQIVGRANRIIFSLDYNDYYLPRKNRFFHALR